MPDPVAHSGETVEGLGEAGVLGRILPRLRGAKPLLGPGDDAAIIAAPGERFVITVDTMVQDQDFRLSWPNGRETTGFDVGWKSAAQNLSDINAMGAVATAAVISLTIPPQTEIRWLEDFADGFSAAVHELGADECSIAGGDLSRGTEISVTAAVTGRLTRAGAVLRSGARPGDIVAVGGPLGGAAAGLLQLETPKRQAPDGPVQSDFTNAQLRPCPPLKAGPAAAACGATAMMDLSDGLLRDLPRLAQASDVAIELSRTGLVEAAADHVMSWAHQHGLDPHTFVLEAGEDFALVGTFPPSTPLPAAFVPIGRVAREAPNGALSLDGNKLQPGGWDHFTSPPSTSPVQ